ncbi:MAG: response regulator transcription factor [Rikenellaceae bacterium]
MKVLIIEDERELAQTIERTLCREGYVVEMAHSLAQAREKIGVFDYECILLDIMLPDGSGLDLLKEFKVAKRRGGVIIISAKESVEDKVAGLNLGADDYLAKPFHLAELTARVGSIIRRKGNNGGNIIEIGNIKLFIDKSQVSVDDILLDLSRKEYDILLHFAMRQGYVISKETLAEAVWGDFVDQLDNFDFIYAHMKNLRRKLSVAGASAEIKSIYGFGYKISLI